MMKRGGSRWRYRVPLFHGEERVTKVSIDSQHLSRDSVGGRASGLSQLPGWTGQEAMGWLTGSMDAVQLSQATPLSALAVFAALLLSRTRDLEALRLGATRGSLRFTHPHPDHRRGGRHDCIRDHSDGANCFCNVSVRADPCRITRNSGSILIPSALIGAVFVAGGNYVGQFMLPSRYPVGVVMGSLPAPYPVRINRTGDSL